MMHVCTTKPSALEGVVRTNEGGSLWNTTGCDNCSHFNNYSLLLLHLHVTLLPHVTQLSARRGSG